MTKHPASTADALDPPGDSENGPSALTPLLIPTLTPPLAPLPLPDTGQAHRPKASLFGGIGRRLLLSILLFSSLFTLALTAFQLYIDYQRDIGAVERRIEQLRGSYHDSLARSLWNVDGEQLRIQLEGLTRLSDIRAARVEEIGDHAHQPLRVSVGTLNENAPLVWSIPLIYEDRGQSKTIGTLTIEGSMDEIVGRLANRALVILASQGVKTFCVSFFILFIVYSLVTRHLIALARQVRAYDVRDPARPSLADRRNRPGAPVAHDELDQMFDAFNGMQGKLEEAYAELRKTNAALERDIAARIDAEAEVAYLAYHDALTGLANRRRLKERLQQEVPLAERLNRHGALLFIDLDRFKRLNDALGHAVGDALLLEVAHRLNAAVRNTDLVASLGGDKFVLLLTGLGDNARDAAHAAHQIADTLHAALAAPYTIGEQTRHMSASIGVTLFPADGGEAEDLLKNVETALQHAKIDGRNSVHFFQPAMQAAVQARHQLETELREALIGRQFSLAYQPQVDRHGTLRGAEALIRWRHPVHGPVSPAEFIPVAEESTLILEIGAWVMSSALEQLRAWNRADLLPPGFSLAINVSPRQFQQPDFVQRVAQELQRGRVDPRQVTLEITEGMLVGDIDAAIARMQALRDLGVQFHIDDFGTGYSSMSYLKRLPVNGLKIDQSFVRDMLENTADAAIVEAMLAVARSFQLDVVAEGVETAAQRDSLANLGCPIFQGYFFSRPMSADEFAAQYLPGSASSAA